MYFVQSPWWLKQLYPSLVWKILSKEKEIFLTFDDGPHAEATPFVLDTLKKYNALATFFCIGKNVVQHPHIYERILLEGHATGNHTNNHLNGWQTQDEEYVNNIDKAAEVIISKLFRPPYGRIKLSQIALIKSNYKIIMWDVLSADFDIALSPQKSLSNVTGRATKGSIIVFHDSQKALPRLRFALPKVLEFFLNRGFTFLPIK